MMNAGIRLIPVAGLLAAACAGIVTAEDIYIAQNARGDDSGSGPASAHSADWLNDAAHWSAEPAEDGLVGPGDTVHLCGIISSPLTIQGSGAPGRPVTVLFEKDARMSAPYWSTYVNPTRPISRSVRDGVINARDKHYVVIDGGANGIIEATDNGTDRQYQYSFAGILTSGDCHDWEIANLAILNIYERAELSSDHRIFGMGIVFTGGSNVSIHHNVVRNAWYGILYSSAVLGAENIDLHHNTATGTAVGMAAVLSRDGVSLHDVRIHHNRICDNRVWDGDIAFNPYDPARKMHRRDGIKIWGRTTTDDPYSDLSIYRNVIGPGIARQRGVSGWICADSGHFLNTVIRDNYFLSDQSDAHSPFIALSGAVKAVTPINSRIHNNTFIGNGIRGAPIILGRTSTGHRVYDNLFHDYHLDLYTSDEETDIAFFDYNAWYSPKDTRGSFQYKRRRAGRTPSCYTWQTWRDELGFDVHSVTQEPMLVDINDPAGPDGEFFTVDDGLLPSEASPLRAAGRHGGDIGVSVEAAGGGQLNP